MSNFELDREQICFEGTGALQECLCSNCCELCVSDSLSG